jgi:hypothetical protein
LASAAKSGFEQVHWVSELNLVKTPFFVHYKVTSPSVRIVPGVSTTRLELVQRLASRLHDPFENMRTGLYAIYQPVALHAPTKTRVGHRSCDG